MAWPGAPAWTDRDRARNKFLGCQARAKSGCVIKPRVDDQYRPVHLPSRSSATLAQVRPVTHDISEFHFTLAAPMAFEPGQYLLLQLPGIDGLRAYSMSSVPADGACFSLQVRRTPEGKGSAALFGLPAGTTVEVDGPYGMAWLRTDVRRDILCVAGGSGLAPMISIARGAMTHAALADVHLHFVYGGRTVRDICGEDMLRALPGWGERLHYYPAVSDPAGESAGAWGGRTRFAHEVVAELFGLRLPQMEIYFAGPPAMALALQRMLMKAKVAPAQVHFDQFY